MTRLHIPVQCLGVCKKDRFRSNLRSNSHTRIQGSELSTCRLLLLTRYCTSNASTGGANRFPYTGKLTNPHKVAILGWGSFGNFTWRLSWRILFLPCTEIKRERETTGLGGSEHNEKEFYCTNENWKHLLWIALFKISDLKSVRDAGGLYQGCVCPNQKPSGIKNRIHGLSSLLWFDYLQPPNTLQECNILQPSASLSTKGLLCASSCVWVRFKLLSTQAN